MNPFALSLIKQFEGCRLKAYTDSVGVWTIGWGHTGKNVHPGMIITQAQADAILIHDLASCEALVSPLITITLSDEQMGAIIDFAYNLGVGDLAKSTLLKKIKSSDPTASDEFLRWNRAGGRILKGLSDRRAAEQALFLKN